MKKLFLSILLFTSLSSCFSDIDLGGGFGLVPPKLPGIPATFTIKENQNTHVINGDATTLGLNIIGIPGSGIHRLLLSYTDPNSNYYKLESFGTAVNGNQLYITFDLFTTPDGMPLKSLVLGKYIGTNSSFQNGMDIYQAFHIDPAINQQLFSEVSITNFTDKRMEGTFTGSYYHVQTEQIVTVSGEFINVFIY